MDVIAATRDGTPVKGHHILLAHIRESIKRDAAQGQQLSEQDKQRTAALLWASFPIL